MTQTNVIYIIEHKSYTQGWRPAIAVQPFCTRKGAHVARAERAKQTGDEYRVAKFVRERRAGSKGSEGKL